MVVIGQEKRFRTGLIEMAKKKKDLLNVLRSRRGVRRKINRRRGVKPN